jgi:glycosyltransferase involved in cell wall biosynthesis
MKIAIVCFNLFIAGGARLVLDFAQLLKKRGYTPIIYTPAFEAGKYGDLVVGLDIRVIETGKEISHFKSEKPRTILEWLSQKWKHEREFIDISRAIAGEMESDFDVVSLHDSSYRVGFYYKKRNPKTRAVWTVNGPPFRYLPRKKWAYDMFGYAYQAVKRITTRKFMAAIDEATVLANVDKAWFKDNPIQRVSVVRAGLDFKKFYAPVKDVRARFEKKSVTLLALGALNRYRRYDDVLQAVKFLRDWGYDARVRIIANNIWNENECRDSLVDFAKENGIESATEFNFKGVGETELVEAYRQADIFVQAVCVPPPGHHGWGLVNFEAIAAGTPVVLCDSSTATEVLEDGETALFFKPMASRELALQVKKLVDDPELYLRLAEDGQNMVKRTMSWERYTDGMLAAFSTSLFEETL